MKTQRYTHRRKTSVGLKGVPLSPSSYIMKGASRKEEGNNNNISTETRDACFVHSFMVTVVGTRLGGPSAPAEKARDNKSEDDKCGGARPGHAC